MCFYRTNAIYQALADKKIKDFYWVSENAWILVYGDSNNNPKVIVLAFNEKWAVDSKIVSLASTIAKKADLPMFQVRFNSSQPEIDSVELASFDGALNTVSLQQLKDAFAKTGLPVSDKPTKKAINSAESSAYHSWQREQLGKKIVVADIDLIKESDKTTIIELKRSSFELDRWSPFRVDFPNFYVLENLCKMTGDGFFILYNRRVEEPEFFDDPSTVSVFTFNSGNPKKVGIFSFDKLFNNNEAVTDK
ncbi:hypothetical protein [Vibrio sonorensis]|uniref:hypothetical protein n=1 Tax=Vibrio sonorensis TaxID=1004316 RepID=UPI0008D931B0|nr:hypothetical protein [Vibrio sonorensis]